MSGKSGEIKNRQKLGELLVNEIKHESGFDCDLRVKAVAVRQLTRTLKFLLVRENLKEVKKKKSHCDVQQTCS